MSLSDSMIEYLTDISTSDLFCFYTEKSTDILPVYFR